MAAKQTLLGEPRLMMVQRRGLLLKGVFLNEDGSVEERRWIAPNVSWSEFSVTSDWKPSSSRTYPAAFRAIALLLPRRLYIEDLGDALEVLDALDRSRSPRWQRWLKIGSTCIFLLLNTVREGVSAVKGNAGSAAQRKDEK